MAHSMEQESKARRKKAVSMAMKRKEEYLGARVPKELRDRVIQQAKEMGIPVSILIRNILEDAFKEDVSKTTMLSSSPSVKMVQADIKDKFSSVLGWEKIILNKSIPCASCGKQLASGDEVTLGLGGIEPVILCASCKGRI